MPAPSCRSAPLLFGASASKRRAKLCPVVSAAALSPRFRNKSWLVVSCAQPAEPAAAKDAMVPSVIAKRIQRRYRMGASGGMPLSAQRDWRDSLSHLRPFPIPGREQQGWAKVPFVQLGGRGSCVASEEWRRGGGEDPWLLRPRLSPGVPFRGMDWADVASGTEAVKHSFQARQLRAHFGPGRITSCGTAPNGLRPECRSGS
jgi:hypothetical protein